MVCGRRRAVLAVFVSHANMQGPLISGKHPSRRIESVGPEVVEADAAAVSWRARDLGRDRSGRIRPHLVRGDRREHAPPLGSFVRIRSPVRADHRPRQRRRPVETRRRRARRRASGQDPLAHRPGSSGLSLLLLDGRRRGARGWFAPADLGRTPLAPPTFHASVGAPVLRAGSADRGCRRRSFYLHAGLLRPRAVSVRHDDGRHPPGDRRISRWTHLPQLHRRLSGTCIRAAAARGAVGYRPPGDPYIDRRVRHRPSRGQGDPARLRSLRLRRQPDSVARHCLGAGHGRQVVVLHHARRLSVSRRAACRSRRDPRSARRPRTS